MREEALLPPRLHTADVFKFSILDLAAGNKALFDEVSTNVFPSIQNPVTQVSFGGSSKVSILGIGLVTIQHPVVVGVLNRLFERLFNCS